MFHVCVLRTPRQPCTPCSAGGKTDGPVLPSRLPLFGAAVLGPLLLLLLLVEQSVIVSLWDARGLGSRAGVSYRLPNRLTLLGLMRGCGTVSLNGEPLPRPAFTAGASRLPPIF